MNIISAANPRWANAEQTLIDLDIETDKFGVIPFTSSPNDSEKQGRDLFAQAVAGNFGPIAAYVAPPVTTTIPTVVTMRQARLALLGAGLLQSVNDAVTAMTGTAGDAARIEWEYATSVDRGSALVAGLSASLNLTSVQLDSLFTTAATL